MPRIADPRVDSQRLTNPYPPSSQLDRDMAIQPRVMGLVDDAHPSLTQLAEDLVGTELSTG